MANETETPISVNFPADLAHEIKRISGEQNWPESQTIILLARLGMKAQKLAEQRQVASHDAFMKETDPEKQNERADELIRSIFGTDAIG